MSLSVSFELDRVNAELDRYIKVCKKLPEDAIRKQTDEFGGFLFQELKMIAPGKGSLKNQGFALLRAGYGVRVRPTILGQLAGKYEIAPLGGKALFRNRRKVLGGGTQSVGRWRGSVGQGGRRLNLQALAVQAELNLREKSSGFLALSSKFRKLGTSLGGETISRYGGILGQEEIKLERQGQSATSRFNWGSFGVQSLAAAAGLSKPKAELAISNALAAMTRNMRQYIEEKARGFGKERAS